jgi:hypothetical protein
MHRIDVTQKSYEIYHYSKRFKHYYLQYSLIKTVTPAILRMLYFDLTGDAAVTSNIISRKIEERLRLMLALEDPSIIFDLRANNGFKGTKFDIFWNEIDMYFNEVYNSFELIIIYIAKAK